MTTEIRADGLTDVGRSRERNEDSLFVGSVVFAVADGLGGHRAGEVASDLALEPLRALDADGPRKASLHLGDAVRKANKAVHERAQSEPELNGMGTTLTAVAIADGVAYLAHVGDSRCYLLRDGGITQLSRDHTLVARMVSEGKITPEQAEHHPQRSVLTRALGAEKHLDVQTSTVVLRSSDRLLLCSDGLSGVMTDEDLLRLAGTGADLDEICHGLIAEANARGGPDNITAIVIDVARAPTDERAPEPRIGSIPRRIPVRALVWTGLVVAVLGVGWGVMKAWADRSYYVGSDGERVVIYRGLPFDLPGVSFSEVEEPTDVRVDKIDSPAIVRSLEDGIRAPSLEEARRIVDEQIRPNVQGRTPPIRGPTPSPSP